MTLSVLPALRTKIQVLNHRQRLEKCLAGELPDRTPVALWRHFPVDDQTPENLAAATLEFQRTYDFDLVKVTPASSFCQKDWGSEDQWRGHSEGTREYTRLAIHHPEDWERLPVLDPNQGYLGAQLRCLRLIVKELGSDTPVLQTIFNPLSQAKHLAGESTLLMHLRCFPEAVHAGFKIIVESTRRFIEATRTTGIAGLFFAVQHAQYGVLSPLEFETFGKPYDLQVLEPVSNTPMDFWLNMLHLHGEQVMFDAVMDYPVQIINWHDRDTPPTLAEAQARYNGVICGGLRRWDSMVVGTPEQVDAEARDAIQSVGINHQGIGRRFILGTGCVLPIVAPRANIMAARNSVIPRDNIAVE